MIETQVFTEKERPDEKQKKEIVHFLHEHLQQYGDSIPDIERCVDYALKLRESFGGYVITARKNRKLVGAVILNHTGMKGYIPDTILVYIATHQDHRGEGIGKKLMEETIGLVEGDIKLHVEHDNPARFLYEKYGFTNKYLEYRYSKKK